MCYKQIFNVLAARRLKTTSFLGGVPNGEREITDSRKYRPSAMQIPAFSRGSLLAHRCRWQPTRSRNRCSNYCVYPNQIVRRRTTAFAELALSAASRDVTDCGQRSRVSPETSPLPGIPPRVYDRIRFHRYERVMSTVLAKMGSDDRLMGSFDEK